MMTYGIFTQSSTLRYRKLTCFLANKCLGLTYADLTLNQELKINGIPRLMCILTARISKLEMPVRLVPAATIPKSKRNRIKECK